MNPKETPEQHVRQATSRQKRVAKTAADKATVLALATEALSSRVGTLADVVQINNAKIDEFAKELKKKPDDTEVQFIAGLATNERQRHLRYALVTGITTSVVAAVVAGFIAYSQAHTAAETNCQRNAQNIATIVSILDAPQLRETYANQIADLRSNRNTCR